MWAGWCRVEVRAPWEPGMWLQPLYGSQHSVSVFKGHDDPTKRMIEHPQYHELSHPDIYQYSTPPIQTADTEHREPQ